VKSSDLLRLERYLTFHISEIVEKLRSKDEGASNARWTAKWGSSARLLEECLLRTREEIGSALARIRDGTYGDCVGCGNEIGLGRLEVVPWAEFCIVCQEKLKPHRQAENRFLDRSRFSTPRNPNSDKGSSHSVDEVHR